MRLLNSEIDCQQSSTLSPHPRSKKRSKNQFHFDMRSELYRVFGVDLTANPGISGLTAHTFLAEVGPDLSRFASAAAFVSWLALCPANKKSGGKDTLVQDTPDQ